MSRAPIHTDLASGRWFQLSLAEQLANIGSEVSRAAKWQTQKDERFDRAVDRALELFDLTIADPRWKHRLSGTRACARDILRCGVRRRGIRNDAWRR